ncbi:hypothetical protein QBC39DRAFT_415145, partial [Podospora conica]
LRLQTHERNFSFLPRPPTPTPSILGSTLPASAMPPDSPNSRIGYQASVQSIIDGWKGLWHLGNSPMDSAVVCLVIVARAAMAIIPADGEDRHKMIGQPGPLNSPPVLAKLLSNNEMPSAETVVALKSWAENMGLTDFESIAESNAMYELMWNWPKFTTMTWSSYFVSLRKIPTLGDWHRLARASLLVVELEPNSYDFSAAVNAAVDRVIERSSHEIDIGSSAAVMRVKYLHREGVDPKDFLLFQKRQGSLSNDPGSQGQATFPDISTAFYQCFAAVKLRSSPDGFDTVRLLPVLDVQPKDPGPNTPWALQPPTFTDGFWYMLYFVLVQDQQASSQQSPLKQKGQGQENMDWDNMEQDESAGDGVGQESAMESTYNPWGPSSADQQSLDPSPSNPTENDSDQELFTQQDSSQVAQGQENTVVVYCVGRVRW